VVSAEFGNFFVASAGAGAALAGLLFVAIAVSPERIFGETAPPEARAVATSAFTALLNAFFVSLAALIPGNSLGYIALTIAGFSFLGTVRLLASLVQRGLGFRRLARRLFLAVLSGALYAYEGWFALNLVNDPSNPVWASALAGLLLGIYGMAVTRAWELLGAERQGLLAWLSPLRDINRAVDSGGRVHAAGNARKHVGRHSVDRN
jgi:modulator of FtsH protease